MTTPEPHPKESKIHLAPLLLTSVVAGGILAVLAPYGTASQSFYIGVFFGSGFALLAA